MCNDNNLEKFNAYKKTAENYSEAVSIISSKRLVYGEPAVVPFKEHGSMKLLFGIGGIDGNNAYMVFGDETDSRVNAYKSIDEICEYLYKVEYDNIDYNFARNYFATHNDVFVAPACSSIRRGNFYGRNLDWYYSNSADFVVKTKKGFGRKHSVIGVSGGLPWLTNEKVKSGEYDFSYKLIPFYLQDGINDAGVFCNLNVVHKDKPYKDSSIDPKDESQLIGIMVPRFVLDNFSTAFDAVEALTRMDIYVPNQFIEQKHVFHFMIGDESSTYILEMVGNGLVVVDESSHNGIMTNFYTNGITYNSDRTVYTNNDSPVHKASENGITSHGCGLERYNKLLSFSITTESDMRNAMSSVFYTNMYKDDTNPTWYSEVTGEYGSIDITVDTPHDDTAINVALEKAKEYFENRKRDDFKSWITSHSSVYTISERKLSLVVQEDTANEYSFTLDNNISENCEEIISNALCDINERISESNKNSNIFVDDVYPNKNDEIRLHGDVHIGDENDNVFINGYAIGYPIILKNYPPEGEDVTADEMNDSGWKESLILQLMRGKLTTILVGNGENINGYILAGFKPNIQATFIGVTPSDGGVHVEYISITKHEDDNNYTIKII